MSSFSDFISIAQNSKHHALLLITGMSKNEQSISDEYFPTVAQELCGLKIGSNAQSFLALEDISHPDLFVVNRQRKILRLEDLVKIHEICLYPPQYAKRRLVYIENCDRMNLNAANALLKILEEPLAEVLFILTCKNLKLIYPTIASRCQKIKINFTQTEDKNNILNLISSEDYNLIKKQIERFNPDSVFSSGSNNFQGVRIKNSQLVKSIVDFADKLAKEYDAQLLRDIIVHITSDFLKNKPDFLMVAKMILSHIKEWQDNEAFNPSTQLWLLRIFLGFQVN